MAATSLCTVIWFLHFIRVCIIYQPTRIFTGVLKKSILENHEKCIQLSISHMQIYKYNHQVSHWHILDTSVHWWSVINTSGNVGLAFTAFEKKNRIYSVLMVTQIENPITWKLKNKVEVSSRHVYSENKL